MSTASVKPVFDDGCKFVTSYLVSPKLLGCLRLLLGLYTLVTSIVILVWEAVKLDEAESYFSYFTHLSYIGITAWFWASAVQSLAFACSTKRGDRTQYPLQSWPWVLQFLHKLLFSTIATFPIIVTVVYWVLLASSESFSSAYNAWSNLSQHILNVVFILFEILCTNIPPLEWIQLPITIVILGLYLGVAYLTYATQGFYTYSFLNPQKQGVFLAAYIVGIAVGQVIVFIIVRYVIVARGHLVKNHYSRG